MKHYVRNSNYDPKNHKNNMRLDDRHYLCAQMRFEKKSYKEIAKACGVSTETIKTWVLHPTFKKIEQQLRNSVQTRVKRRLLNMSDKVLDTLEKALEGDTVSGNNLKACELIFRYGGLEPDKNINLQADITNTQLTLEEKKKMLLEKLAGEVLDDDEDEENDIINDDVIDIEDYTIESTLTRSEDNEK